MRHGGALDDELDVFFYKGGDKPNAMVGATVVEAGCAAGQALRDGWGAPAPTTARDAPPPRRGRRGDGKNYYLQS